MIRITVFKFPPGKHIGEAEEDVGGKSIGGAAAVKADREAATSAVEVGRGHVVGMDARFHDAKILF